ncbi:MAG TPA: hypothetical protein VGE95_10420 [Arthrobacter sp.]
MSLAEALDAPGQGAGGVASVVEGALADGLVEEGGRVVPCLLGLREHRGEGIPSGFLQNALGVLGDGLLNLLGEAVLGLQGGRAVGEAVQDRSGDVCVGVL